MTSGTRSVSNVLYVDTNIIIYLLEDPSPFGTKIASRLEAIVSKGDTLISSTLLITEFLAGSPAGTLLNLQLVPTLTFQDVNVAIANSAALLQREHTLRIGDAIHLATAISVKARRIYSNDRKLIKIAALYLPVETDL